MNDVRFLDRICFEPSAFYVLDRGYHDFMRLYRIHAAGAFFVTRARSNTKMQRGYSRGVDRRTGVIADQVVFLTGVGTSDKYPETLRRIKYRAEDGRSYVFLTNNTIVSPSSIALLYKHRRQIELFFKWIKQHLKIKAFWGRSENAVKSQIRIALCAYLIVAIIKKCLGVRHNLYEILQILSVSLFDKNTFAGLFSNACVQKRTHDIEKTPPLFEF